MATTTAPTQAGAAEARPGFIRLLIGMIARPRPTLHALHADGGRAWLLMAALALVLALLPIWATHRANVAQARSATVPVESYAVEAVPGPGGAISAGPGRVVAPLAPGEMPESMPAPTPSAFMGLVLPGLGAVGGLAISWLAWSGSLYVLATMLGGRHTFGRLFQMVVWTWVPYAVRGAVQTVYILATGTVIANPGLSGFAPGASAEMSFLPPSPGQIVLRALLARVDLYLFWNLFLLVLGVMTVAGLSRRKSLMVTAGVFAVLTALSLLPALLGSLIGGGMVS